jgi:hypothetical protein
MRSLLHTLRLVLRERLRPGPRVSREDREAWERERQELAVYRGQSEHRRRRAR